MSTSFTVTYSSGAPLGLQVQTLSKTVLKNDPVASLLGTQVVVTQILSDHQSANLTLEKYDLVTHIGKTRFKGSIDEFVNKIAGKRAKTFTITFARVNNPTLTTTKKSSKQRASSKGRSAASRKASSKKNTAKTSASEKKSGPRQRRASSKGRKSTSSFASSSPSHTTNVEEEHLAHFSRHGTRVPDQGDQDKVRLHNDIPVFVALTTYLGYVVLTVFGRLRDFFGRCTSRGRYFSLDLPKDKAPIVDSWDNFYARRMKHRINDIFQRPVTGPPAASGMNLLVRDTPDQNRSFQLTGETKRVINLGSYNYLGFADDWKETCRDSVVSTFDDFGTSMCSSPMDAGTTVVHAELEALVCEFLNKEACCVFNMGYGTNASTLPALVGKGSLIISDSLNHSSIVNGARASGSTIRVFKHDNPSHLEQVLRNAIIAGQPRTSRPWKKILVVCEGIYSMEGEIGHFKEIVEVCKKHKAYVYVDEAHSIGALGATGRGVAEKCGVDTADIDIMMGTFTKSFGGMGGYIAGSKDLVDYIRATSSGMIYSNAMSPVICKQILRALQVIMGLDGTDIGQRKLDDLRNNSNYFRKGLVNMGLQVLGDADSPVMPVLLYNPTKIGAFSRECLKRGLAVVCVGFPATPLIESRARFCISAGHTKENLDYALEQIDEIADLLKLKYDANWLG